jgi:CheY-like chemotaxis protein
MDSHDDSFSDLKVNVLLVDDQPANLLALEAVLEVLGQNLVRARSGEEALHLLRDDYFAVVLLDVQMPGLLRDDYFAVVLRRGPARRADDYFAVVLLDEESFDKKGG